ncbi:hypothetical protein C4K88_12120 [Arthrobacter pityocampae]|uniref:Uncharacterized protein n=2 Tax=Arthrobacter pityocampae TaxID=547334 RepID=A0A2S5IVA8_9MICC|nr:hypothetical protein C4K88_12120 [Arthrobacter pityocampae]
MKGSIMTENSNEGHIVNPNKGDGSTSDPNWHGDAGDQGNDLRFAEEQALINEQAEGGSTEATRGTDAGDAEHEGHYTSAEPAGESGGYTSAENPAEEGEYTDKDRPLIDPPHTEGEYTDRDR